MALVYTYLPGFTCKFQNYTNITPNNAAFECSSNFCCQLCHLEHILLDTDSQNENIFKSLKVILSSVLMPPTRYSQNH